MKKILIESIGVEVLVSDELCVLLNKNTGKIETSKDGTNWTRRESPQYDWVNIQYENGEFSVTAESGEKLVSTDTIRWTRIK